MKHLPLALLLLLGCPSSADSSVGDALGPFSLAYVEGGRPTHWASIRKVWCAAATETGGTYWACAIEPEREPGQFVVQHIGEGPSLSAALDAAADRWAAYRRVRMQEVGE